MVVAASSAAAKGSGGGQSGGAGFAVSPSQGVLPGRGLGMPHTQQLVVTFAPLGEGEAEVQLRFAVAGGPTAVVQVRGRGSLDEAVEWHAHLTRL